jgi:hypothetical protein
VTVHSTQLGHNVAVGVSEVTLYTVPTGKRALLKGYVICNTSSSANELALELYNGATLLAFWREFLAIEETAGDTIIRTPWLVLDAGQALKAVAAHASVSVLLAGTELLL